MRLLAALLLGLVATVATAADGGLPAALSAYAGKVVYLDFWASWCGPCAQSFPWLNRMHERYGDQLVVVGINVDADPAAADAFLKRHPARFDIVRDPAGALPEHYRIEGMPTSVIVGADGRVLHQHSGFWPDRTSTYEAAIRHALTPEVRR